MRRRDRSVPRTGKPSGNFTARLRRASSATNPSAQHSCPVSISRSSSRLTAPSDLAAEKRTFASRKIRIALESASGFLPAGQDLLQVGLGFVELADPLFPVDLDRERHRGAEQQAFGRRLRDEMIVGLEAERGTQFRRQRYDAAASDGKGGFHGCRIAEMQ